MTFIVTATVKDKSGTWWTYISGQPGKTVLAATKRGVASTGWDMVEEQMWRQPSLEPAEGFAR